MGPRVKKLAGSILSLVLGLVIGFAVGQRQGFKMGMEFLETQVDGTLSIHVETASCIRVGDTKRALELLDMMIDSAVTSVVAQPGPLRAPSALSQAKLYRSVVPAAGPAASDVRTALERVPAMQVPRQTDPSPTRSGLLRLARQAGA
jgi:hypothetical protein